MSQEPVLRLTGEQLGSIEPPVNGVWFVDFDEYEEFVPKRLLDAERARPVPDGLREAGDGYEVLTWVEHQPSGVVVLQGHPQLGGRYCLTDGGDWPCARVRAALEALDAKVEEMT